jgi:hypothetical protein
MNGDKDAALSHNAGFVLRDAQSDQRSGKTADSRPRRLAPP